MLVKVCEGHTTMESPVCIPTGSRFSMLQMVIAVSFESRITSYSISLKPFMLFSISTWCTGESLRAFFIISSNSLSFSANPPPVPPNVNAGRRTTGKPIDLATFSPSSIECAMSDGSTGSLSLSHNSLNSSLSSAISILLLFVPKSSVPHSARIPFFSSCMARFRPVCPPRPGSMASGLS